MLVMAALESLCRARHPGEQGQAIRQRIDAASAMNQRLYQWAFSHTRFLLTYKAERCGMQVVEQEERHTWWTCPACRKRKDSKKPVAVDSQIADDYGSYNCQVNNMQGNIHPEYSNILSSFLHFFHQQRGNHA